MVAFHMAFLVSEGGDGACRDGSGVSIQYQRPESTTGEMSNVHGHGKHEEGGECGAGRTVCGGRQQIADCRSHDAGC